MVLKALALNNLGQHDYCFDENDDCHVNGENYAQLE